MTTHPEADDLAIAAEYAAAYAGFDAGALRRVLSPRLRYRQINPGGVLCFDSADGYVDATADFLAGFTSHEAVSHDAEIFGDRVVTASRTRLGLADRTFLMEHREVLTIADGRIVAIDAVCTGPRPLQIPTT